MAVHFCLFAIWRGAEPAAAFEERLARVAAATPGLAAALAHTPDTASDPFLNDGRPPALALQLYFDSLPALEAAAARDGPLQALADPSLWSEPPDVEHQAMLVRAFDVPEPGAAGCTYLVAYEGPAEDPHAWLAAYLDHHPAMMATLPGIRALELYTRVDWIGFLPWRRVEHLQRNKVAFDSAAALTAALHSPVREAMRAHFHALPPIAGRVTHYPMATRALPVAAPRVGTPAHPG